MVSSDCLTLSGRSDGWRTAETETGGRSVCGTTRLPDEAWARPSSFTLFLNLRGGAEALLWGSVP